MNNALVPIPPFSLTQAGVNVNGIMDAAAEKVAFIGYPTWNGAATSKSIRRVVLRLGAITVGTGSTFRVSLQNVDTSAGPPGVPDGTPDENWTSLVSALTANAILETGDLSADRAVTRGTPLAIVCDFSVYGATSSVVVNTLQSLSSQALPGSVLFTAAWAALGSGLPEVALIFSDGTRGTLAGAALVSNTSATDYNNATTSTASLDSGDERGTKWVPSRPGTITAIMAAVRVAGATSDFDVAIYRGTTLVASVAVEGNMMQAGGAYSTIRVPLESPLRFAAGDLLYFVIKPTTANNVRVIAIDFHAAADLELAFNDEVVSWAQRADAGAWVENTGHALRVGAVFPIGEFDAAVLTGSYALSGTVLNGVTPVENATVCVIDRVTGLTTTTLTDVNGDWSISVESNAADRYAAYAEYENGGILRNALAPWALTAA